MKRMKRLLSGCLIAALCVTLLCGCPPQEKIGVAHFVKAADALWSHETLTVQTDVTRTYTYMEQTETEKASYTTAVSGLGTDDFKARTVAEEDGDDFIEYYADGYAYRQYGIMLYKAPKVLNEYDLNVWDIRITPEIYRSVEVVDTEDGITTLRFSDAVKYEPWVTDGEVVYITDPLLSISAQADLDCDGNLTAIRYKAESAYGAFRMAEEITCTYTVPDDPIPVQMPGEAATCPILDDVECVPHLVVPEAYENLYKMRNYSATAMARYVSEADGVEHHSMYGTLAGWEGDTYRVLFTADRVSTQHGQPYWTGQFTESYDSDTKVLKIVENDGKETTKDWGEYMTASVKAAFIEWSSLFSANDEVFNSTVTDMGDAWKISFVLPQKRDAAIVEHIGETFYTGDKPFGDYPIETVSHTVTVCVSKKDHTLLSHIREYEGTVAIKGIKHRIAAQERAYFVTPLDTVFGLNDSSKAPDEPLQKATPLLYRVTGKDGGELYLFGTTPYGDARSHYLPDEVYAALDEADAFAQEVTLSEVPEQAYAQAVQKMLSYTDGTSLKNHLTEEVYNDLVLYLNRMGYFEEQDLGEYSVDYWRNLIDGYQTAYMDSLSEKSGVAKLLEERAKGQGKKLYSMQDWKEELENSASLDDEIKNMLMANCLETDVQDYEQRCQYQYEMWCAGVEADLSAFNSADTSVNLSEADKQLYAAYLQKMYTAPNTALLKAIEEYLASGETVFAAVDCQRVFGKDGIAAQLKAAGYTVEVVQYAQ